jgi:aspartate kinase
MKFGGTSVEDAPAFERVAAIVESQETMRPIVVVSAMSGMTDALLASVRYAKRGQTDAALRSLAEPFERHRRIARTLKQTFRLEIEALIDHAQEEIADRLTLLTYELMSPHLQDVIASFGEDLSANLLTMLLRTRGVQAHYVDARRCIITDEAAGCAAPLPKQTEQQTRATLGPLVQVGNVPVLGGFIGATLKGVTTTLGRGGSDYTASLIAAAMRAREIQIWTDVTGVLTTDPRVVKSARTVTRLSYAEAAELAYFGAKVLHPKTIQPAVKHDIPLRICNSRAPEEFGTLICSAPEGTPRTVKAVAHKSGVTIVKVTSARFFGSYGFLRRIFEIFDHHRTVVDVVTTSEVSLSLSLDEVSSLPDIVKELQEIGSVEVRTNLAVVCVVGEGLCGAPSIPAAVFNSIRGIPVLLISQGSSSSNLTFVVEQEFVESVIMRLHETFFENWVEPLSDIAGLELEAVAD